MFLDGCDEPLLFVGQATALEFGLDGDELRQSAADHLRRHDDGLPANEVAATGAQAERDVLALGIYEYADVVPKQPDLVHRADLDADVGEQIRLTLVCHADLLARRACHT